MRRLLLLPLLFLLAPTAFAQDGLVSSAETNKATYAYGETILFRYTITNVTDEPVRFVIGCPNIPANISYGPLPGVQQCITAKLPFRFAPRSSRTWVWEIIPNVYGVPVSSGKQTITADFGGSLLPAAASFQAPQYLGGRLQVGLANGVALADVQDVAQALNAVLIERGFYNSYLVEISGTTLEDAIASYEDDPRFRYIEASRSIYPNGGSPPITTPDPTYGEASLDAPILTAPGPNPFTTSTSFALTVPTAGPVHVEVYDLLGRRVATLHDGPLSAAEHHFTFTARTLPAGLYVVRASGQGFSKTRRVTLAR